MTGWQDIANPLIIHSIKYAYDARYITKHIVHALHTRMYDLYRRHVTEEPVTDYVCRFKNGIYHDPLNNDDYINSTDDEDDYDVDENGKHYDIFEAAEFDEQVYLQTMAIGSGDESITEVIRLMLITLNKFYSFLSVFSFCL